MIFSAYRMNNPRVRSIISCLKSTKQWHYMRFWIYIHYQKNLKEVKEHSSGRNFHFLHSLNPETLQSEMVTHWTAPIVSGIYQISKRNSQNSSMIGLMTESSTIDTLLDLWTVFLNWCGCEKECWLPRIWMRQNRSCFGIKLTWKTNLNWDGFLMRRKESHLFF